MTREEYESLKREYDIVFSQFFYGHWGLDMWGMSQCGNKLYEIENKLEKWRKVFEK